MVLPRGNTLIEKISLPFADINTMLNNLEQQGFTGYVKLDFDTKTAGVIFFLYGGIVNSVEMENSHVKISPLPKILNRVKRREASANSYVLSAPIVGVLSSIFAFQPLYMDYQIKKKEIEKILSKAEEEGYTGIVELRSREVEAILLVEKGTIIRDNFTAQYGQIICGNEAINQLVESISRTGGTLNMYAEKAGEIDAKKRMIQEELDRIKQLVVKSESALFKGGSQIKVDESIVKEWGLKTGSTFSVEVETAEGDLQEMKCTSGKKLSGYVAIPAQLLKKSALREGDLLSIRPLL